MSSKLYMVLVGCKPPGRHTEQHDIFFGIANNLSELLPGVISFWPEAKNKIHLDAWREVTAINNYSVKIIPRNDSDLIQGMHKLFFINLGGYKKDEFEEFHYKMIVVAENMGDAIKQAKLTAFYKHTGFEDAPSHVDDTYGLDVDDIYEVQDLLPASIKNNFSIQVMPGDHLPADELHLGYFKFSKITDDGL